MTYDFWYKHAVCNPLKRVGFLGFYKGNGIDTAHVKDNSVSKIRIWKGDIG